MTIAEKESTRHLEMESVSRAVGDRPFHFQIDGTPVVTWAPNVTDGSRVYHIWDKKSLADAD